MIAQIFASAESKTLPQDFKASELVIAADGGANICYSNEIKPHLIVGDLDSVADEVLAYYRQTQTEVLQFDCDKEHTDFELSYREACKRGAQAIEVYAWADERIDYLLDTLNCLGHSKIPVTLFADTYQIRILNEHLGEIKLDLAEGKKLSIYSLSDRLSLHSSGLKWELQWVDQARARSQSNEVAKAPVKLRLSQGSAFVLVEQGLS